MEILEGLGMTPFKVTFPEISAFPITPVGGGNWEAGLFLPQPDPIKNTAKKVMTQGFFQFILVSLKMKNESRPLKNWNQATAEVSTLPNPTTYFA
jgi:hypothetical protein